MTLADGMFLLVSFQLDLLLKPRTLTEMRNVLAGVSTKLNDFYELTLQRIKDRESDLALKTLAWIVLQIRPLSVRELQEALAIEQSSGAINPDAILDRR